jgi:hypothetical protein
MTGTARVSSANLEQRGLVNDARLCRDEAGMAAFAKSWRRERAWSKPSKETKGPYPHT